MTHPQHGDMTIHPDAEIRAPNPAQAAAIGPLGVGPAVPGSPTSPDVISPQVQQVMVIREGVTAGTDGVSSTANPLILEAVNDITTALQRQPYVGREKIGIAASSIGRQQTAEWDQITIDVPFRCLGIASMFLAAMFGNAMETTSTWTGSPILHKFQLLKRSNRMNTFTIYHDTGDISTTPSTSTCLKMNWCTPQQIQFTPNAQGTLDAQITLVGQRRTLVDVPTPTVINGVTSGWPGTRTMGDSGTFVLYNADGDAYANRITGGQFTVARPVDPEVAIDSKTPTDFTPGELTFNGNLQYKFDGTAASKIYGDYVNFSKLGTSTKMHSIKFTDDDTNYVELVSWPWHWMNWTGDMSGTATRGTVDFEADADLPTAFLSSGSYLSILQATIANGWAQYMNW